MQFYRKWLLELARQFMLDDGAQDAAHDYDHLERVIALADKIQASEGGQFTHNLGGSRSA